jgi:gliding motility-associated-like protein
MTSGQTSIAFYKNKVQFGLRKPGKQKMKSRTELGSTAFAIWEMSFENMNPDLAILAEEKFPSRFNQFFPGSEVSVDLEEYGKLTYKNVYDNIDLVFYLNKDETLKYDFIVHPGGDYSQIKLNYNGLKKIKTDSKGNLTLVTPWGNKIKEGKPVSWQITPNGKVPVDINYAVNNSSVSYKSSSLLLANSTLVIDPMMLDWSTYFYGKIISSSGWGWTYLLDMDIDKDNYVYACGMTTEAYPINVGTYDTSMGSFNYEGFVAKMALNADSLILFTYIGGASWEYILSIAVNAQKQPVISGFTYSNDYPITSNAYDKSGGSGSGYRGFITKFSSDFKSLVFSTYFGKSNTWGTVIQSMQLTPNGDVIFTGNTSAQDFPTTAGCYQNTYGGGTNDAFLTRLSADGSKLIYSTYFGGTGDDKAADLSVNATEDVYLVGSTANSNFPLTAGAQGPFKYTNSDMSDGFVARIQKDGKKLLWSKMMGGSDIDAFEGLYVNSNDELYIAGYSKSGNFYTTANAVQPASNGGYDHVVVKMNKSGTNVFFSTYLGGSADDIFWHGSSFWNSNIRICANVKDEAIIGGATKSNNYPITSDAIQLTNNAKGNTWACNLAITKLSYDGSKILYGTYFGGSYYEYPTVLKVKKISCMSSILYGGITLSKDYPTTKGVFHEKGKTGSSWYYQGFMTRFRDTLYTEPIGFKNDFIECDNVYEILDAKNRGGEYLWSDGSKKQLLIVEDTGKYWVRATYGCDTVSDTIRIRLEYSPQLNLTKDTTLCNNTSGYTIDAKNDTILRKYLWSTKDTTQTINVTKPGLYKVTVTTPHCGSLEDSTLVKFLKKPKITNIRDSLFCDSINWVVKTDSLGVGTKYNWSTKDSGLTTKITKVGNYYLKVKNYCGEDSVNFKTTLLNTPSVNLPKDTTVCDIFSLHYKIGKPNNEEYYLWFDPINKVGYGIKDTFTINTPGLWGASVKNSCGEAIDSIKISQLFSPKLNLGNDSVYCNTISKLIKIGIPNNGETYLWSSSNTSNSETITNAGTYWASVKNICGEKRDTIVFTQKNSLTIDLGNDSVFCNSVSKSFDITQPDVDAIYLWNDGSSGKTYTSTKPEKVWASISNLCGTVKDSVYFTMITTPTVNLGKDYTFCDNVSPVSLNVGKTSNDEIYLWSDSKTTNSNTFTNAGKHWVELKNKCGTASDTMQIVVIVSPTVNVGPDTALCGYFSLPLDAGNTGLTYYWEPTGEITQTIVANKQAVYKVTVTDANGCFGMDEMQVKDDCKSKWYIPTSFSPNGDLINDEFIPVLVNCENYSLKIYNAWGEKLFETNDPNEKWDGSYKGKILPDGNYLYIVNFKSSENKKWYNLSGGLKVLK